MPIVACLLLKTANPGVPVRRRAAPATARVLFILLAFTVSRRTAGAPQPAQAFAIVLCLNTGDSNFGEFEYVLGSSGFTVLFATSEYSPHCSQRNRPSFIVRFESLNSVIQKGHCPTSVFLEKMENKKTMPRPPRT